MALLELNIGTKKKRKKTKTQIVGTDILPIGIGNKVLDKTLTLDEALKIHFLKALKASGGDKNKAAKNLGITERTVYNLLNSWQLGYSPDITSVVGDFDGVSYVHFKETYVRKVVNFVGNKSKAAKELNIALKSVYNILG